MTICELPIANHGRLKLRGRLIRGAITIALLPLAGCACWEADLDGYEFEAAGADRVSIQDYPECSFSNLRQHSQTSAELTDTADPQLLAEARREAEQDCLREKSQHRFSVSDGWHTTLK